MEFVPCRKCNNGWLYKMTDDGMVAVECECHKKWDHENTVEKTYKHNGFDTRHYNYNPRTYAGTKSVKDKDRIINYVEQFDKNPAVRSLVCYLYGPNGTQKTTMMSWVGHQLLDKGYSVRYMLMNDLVKLLMDAEDFNQEKAEKAKAMVEKLEETDLIIIDESFDKSKTWISRSGYELGTLDSWIRKRVSCLNKGIFFISNVLPSDIASQNFSASISDFIQRETTIHKTLLKFEDNYLKSTTVEFDGSLF